MFFLRIMRLSHFLHFVIIVAISHLLVIIIDKKYLKSSKKSLIKNKKNRGSNQKIFTPFIIYYPFILSSIQKVIINDDVIFFN